MTTEEKKVSLPARKVENTLGGGETGGNFFFADNEKQGRLNAQVGTGHMAGIPEEKKLEVSEPEKGKRFDLDRERNLNFPEKEVLQEATPPTNNSGWKNISGAKKNQQTQQTQQVAEPEGFVENGVRYKDATDRNAKTDGAEFGGLKNALPKEEVKVEEKVEEKTEEPKGQDVNVNTFLQGSTTELFGKMITGADTAPYDHNSTEWLKAEARLNQYQKINALSVPQLASSIKAGSILSGGQAMRDLQTYNPEKYQQLQEYQQKEDTLNQINMIASGNIKDSATNLQDKTGESINNYLSETVANAGGDALARMDLDTALSQNQGLINYAERMSYYQGQINQIDQTISNLAEDARKKLREATGENVLEYQVQNYINNRSKKLYKQRENLMNQYNYYKGVYEAQIEEEATKWERDYKERQLKLQEDKAIRDQAIDQAKLSYDYDKLYKDGIDMSKYSTSQEAGQGLQSYITSIQDKIASNAKIRSGGCGTVVNDYLKSLGINFQYDDNKSTKLASRNTTTPTIGSIAIWDKTGTTDGNTYGHVAIVTGINGDGTITVLESNKGTGLRYHKYNQSNVFGYYNPYENSNSNDKSYTELLSGKIGLSDFLKKRNGNENFEDILDWIGDKYFQTNPINSANYDLNRAVTNLSKAFNMGGSSKEERENAENEARGTAEGNMLYALNNSKLNSTDRISLIYNYFNENYDIEDKDILVDLLSNVLKGRYKSKKELNKDLKTIGENSWWIGRITPRNDTFMEDIWENIK